MRLHVETESDNMVDENMCKIRGRLEDEYNVYIACSDDGNGVDITTGQPLKTFEEWLNS